mmetsp:Transcript_32723/g.105708  ORF Transcript_32723/g.105708 Transcript_32723/m.105708 type:complete len:343 (+) Transcript_32723:573-1601(+)
MPASVAARHVAASRAGSRTVAAGSTHDRRARWAAQATGCVGGGSISGQSGRLATSQAYCSLAYRRTSPGSTRRSGMGREGEAVSPSVEALRIGSLCSVNRHSSMTKPHGAPQATGMGAPARSSRAAMAPVTRPAVSHSAAVTNDTNSDRSMQREWSTPRNRLASRSCLADSVTTWPACAANWAAVPSPPGSSARVTPYRSTASTIRSMASETCSRAWDGGTRATAVHAAASGSIWARKERPAAAAAADGACSSTCCVRALLDVGTTVTSCGRDSDSGACGTSHKNRSLRSRATDQPRSCLIQPAWDSSSVTTSPSISVPTTPSALLTGSAWMFRKPSLVETV